MFDRAVVLFLSDYNYKCLLLIKENHYEPNFYGIVSYLAEMIDIHELLFVLLVRCTHI